VVKRAANDAQDSTSRAKTKSGKSRQQRWADQNTPARWAPQLLSSALRMIDQGISAVCATAEECLNPLRVTWLCRHHHARLHAVERRAARGA
jgi:hypothetical protein